MSVLALRRTVFLDGERRADDYEVRDDGRTVGRILRLRSTGRELWQWTQIRPEPRGDGYPRRIQGGVPSDVGRVGAV
jgi:hypothetical protein